MKIKLNLTWKIWLLIIVLALSLFSIFGLPPQFLKEGVLISSVETNSTAFEQGLRQGQLITEINGKEITNIDNFSNIIQEKFPSEEKIKTTIKTNGGEFILYSDKAPKILVSEIPKTNLRTGLDLSGGSRALVKAVNKELSREEVNDLVDITSNRFNEFGITDIKVYLVSDLTGNHYMAVEIAGATPEDLENLISEQGKFEAKIGNETVFVGGEKDITSVSRSSQESGIYSCEQKQDGGYFCNFRFTIYLSQEAAKRHAEITKDLDVNTSSQGNYLSKTLDLYLDDKLVNSLQISEGLKGRVTTQVQISGSGEGATRDEAVTRTEEEMKQLQTVLITGSLPFKLEIIKLDTISPKLGKDFSKTIFLAAAAALLAITLIVFLRYKKLKSSLFLLLISVSEVIIILGVASLIKWDLDLPSIAGILAAIGTGIDSQIIVLDESQQNKNISIKQRMKRAFAIILGAYFTALAALIPLYWAVAGLFKGFAITTIIGITTGILITRPAFTDIIQKIEE